MQVFAWSSKLPPSTDGEYDGAVAESEESGEWQTSQDNQTTQPHFEVQYEGIPSLLMPVIVRSVWNLLGEYRVFKVFIRH